MADKHASFVDAVAGTVFFSVRAMAVLSPWEVRVGVRLVDVSELRSGSAGQVRRGVEVVIIAEHVLHPAGKPAGAGVGCVLRPPPFRARSEIGRGEGGGVALCVEQGGGICYFVALGVAYLSPSNLIYTLVGYVWAGIGSTFSVVILFSLFWRRFHGMAVLATVVSGMIFTILWMVR